MQSTSDPDSEEKEGDTKEHQPRVPRVFRSKSRTPLKYLGRKCTSKTTRLYASSKVWGHAIPTRNCDIIMTLPASTDDMTLMWLLARLRTRTPEIHVYVRHWKNTNVYAFYMTSDYQHLLHGADELGLMKPLKEVYGGGMKEFMMEEQHCYQNVDDESHFLSSRERQSILYHMLLNMRAVQGESLGKIKFLEGQSIVPLLESKSIVSQVFPLHETDTLLELRKTWVQTFVKNQPLEKVSEYFGVKIAMYFAYLGHYTQALVVPTLVGCLFWFIQMESQVIEDICFMTFALFNVFWGTVYIENWRRRSSELAYKWGTLDKKDVLLQDPRPLYTGDVVMSPVTGRLEMCYPTWKRLLFRYCVTVPVIGICLTIVFIIMLLIFELQEWTNGLVKSEDVPGFCSFLPKVLLAVSIGILDEVYKKIAFWLNDQENYRLDEMYEKHLAIKLILFQFVNSFLSLFYIAFYLQDMNRLREQLATLLITRQVIGNIREAIVPYVLWKMKLIKVGYDITGHMSPHTLEKELKGIDTAVDEEQKEGEGVGDKDKHTDSALILTQAEVESTMKKYEDTFDDYLEMFIQYGYVVLFSSAFPLAALCAFLNNIIEIRSDAFKICVHLQRPFAKQVRSIGIWQGALRAMGMIAVVVNSALIGVSGQLKRMKPDLDTMTTIIVIVALEHGILVLKELIAHTIPSKPRWIANEMARWEFQRREALKNHDSPNIRAQPLYYSGSPSTSSPRITSDNPFTHPAPNTPSQADTDPDSKPSNGKAAADTNNSPFESTTHETSSTSLTSPLLNSTDSSSLSASSSSQSSPVVDSSLKTTFTSCSKLKQSRDTDALATSVRDDGVRGRIASWSSKVEAQQNLKLNTTLANTQLDTTEVHKQELRLRKSRSFDSSNVTGLQVKFSAPHQVDGSQVEGGVRTVPSYGISDVRQETRNRILQSIRNRQHDTSQPGSRRTDV